ncbi:6,7-dimethyl-8-ribityllumazine synthase [Candidatus Pantoea carbekii]|uniref:6,7-dimethyl-8-ribityllumazine synthase n=1 Tax=Candidatus Pantoea carbekii TaxID=1235990 RepID=U3U8F7_9GAMM|nr:6,7-dimethyl-8-ribityllumazine synthase [Candidatus Pantoea carbekii]AKC32241.1 6,7-dimethyl-8-ribityllumazine synthase ribH [Candidatus Pantoea carbekii]BAO00777.1 RibH protein [Candidatus Pantoea carbekii]
MKVIEANVSTPDANIAIVISRFNSFITKNLLDGALNTLKRIGQVKEENITVIWVPGAYELPFIIHVLAKTKKYDGIVALGALIRGSTAHFEYIANVVSTGIFNITLNSEIPVTFGVLTSDNLEQAIERAGTKLGNKGSEAALTALEMINILKSIKA